MNRIKVISHNARSFDLPDIAAGLKGSGRYLIGIVAADERRINSKFCIRYFFGGGTPGAIEEYSIFTEDSFSSVSRICPSAKMFEREINDLFGLVPDGHPDLRPLMLYPENWDRCVYPLRKDYDGRLPEIKKYADYKYKEVLGEGIFEIPVGPVHAGIIEPGHFRFSLAGEPIIQLEIRHFWKHRGVEKACEGIGLEEALAIISRISGDNSVNISIAYLEAAETILGIEISESVSKARMILAELERIWNFVRDVAWIFMDIGFGLPAQHLFGLQEEFMRLNKALTGHRFMFDAFTVGGIRNAHIPENSNFISDMIKKAENTIRDFEKFILNSSTVSDRLEFTGKINKKTADELSLCGISARASGVYRDARTEFPYLMYSGFNLKPVTYDGGDVLARTLLRIKEIYLSCSIIKEVLSGFQKEKPNAGAIFKEPEPYSNAVGISETSRGNVFFFIMTDDKGKIFRLKYIDPSFKIWPSIQYGVLGNIIADFPLINKSLNLSYSGNDM